MKAFHSNPFIRNDAPAVPPAPTKTIQAVICNLLPKGVRKDTMEGKDYTVVPMVMLTEGVHCGTDGPLYYSPDELGKTPVVWNHKPIVVYHPEINGVGVSACDPTILTSRKVGVMMNTKYEKGRLTSEAWLDKERCEAVDDRIMKAVDNNEIMELSTGLFVDVESKEGKWQNEDYAGIARNFRPDHLALLPDKTGACSVKDGAGFLRNQDKKNPLFNSFLRWMKEVAGINMTGNEMSFDNIRENLCKALQARYNPHADANSLYSYYVEAVYSNFFIYCYENKSYRLSYTASDTGVTLGDDAPVQVTRVTEYKTVEGAYVGNLNQSKDTMNKKQKVDALIANSGGALTDGDRERLMAFTETQLDRITFATNAGTTAPPVVKPEPTAPVAPVVVPAVTNKEEKGEQKIVSLADYVNNAPAEVREVLNHSLSVYSEEKTRLVDGILANKANVFTKEQLGAKNITELQAIARLAGYDSRAASAAIANYGGQAPVGEGTQSGGEECMTMPALNFEAPVAAKAK